MLNLWNKTTQPAQTWSPAYRPARLSDLAPGKRAAITGFDERLAVTQKELLQAYGMHAGCTVLVIQQRPVTVIQVEHTELAFETEIARLVCIQAV